MISWLRSKKYNWKINLIYVSEAVRSITRLFLKYMLIIVAYNKPRVITGSIPLWKPLTACTVFHGIYQRSLGRTLNYGFKGGQSLGEGKRAEHVDLTSAQSNATAAGAFRSRTGGEEGRKGKRTELRECPRLSLELGKARTGSRRKRGSEIQGSVISSQKGQHVSSHQ